MKKIVAILTVFVASTVGTVAYACSAHAKAQKQPRDENHNTPIVFQIEAKCDGDHGCGGTIAYKVVSQLDGHTFAREGKVPWQAEKSGPATAGGSVHLTFLDEEIVSISVTSVTCE